MNRIFLALAMSAALGSSVSGQPASGPPVNGVLTLEQARALAKETSPVLRQYRSRSKEARFKVDEAYTQAAPTLGLNLGYTRQEPPVTVSAFGLNLPFIVENNYNAQISLRQSIYTFGRLKWAAANAELAEKGHQAELAYQEQRVDEEAKVDFFEARASEEQLHIAQDNVASRTAHLQDANKLVDAGAAAGYDVKRDEAALAAAQQTLLEAQNRSGVARARLFTLLGLDRKAAVTLEPLSAEVPAPPAEVDQALQRAYDLRQDLQASRWALEAAKARVELAAAQDNPNLSLQSDYVQRNAVAFTPGNLWTTGIVFSVPIFDGGLTAAKTGQAREVVTQLESIYDNSRRQVQLEIDSSYLELNSRYQKIQVARVAVASAQEAARIARLRYTNGLSTNVELLDADAALTAAQQDVVNARFQYLQSLAHWDRAVPAGKTP